MELINKYHPSSPSMDEILKTLLTKKNFFDDGSKILTTDLLVKVEKDTMMDLMTIQYFEYDLIPYCTK
jgi:hypothetical protein